MRLEQLEGSSLDDLTGGGRTGGNLCTVEQEVFERSTVIFHWTFKKT